MQLRKGLAPAATAALTLSLLIGGCSKDSAGPKADPTQSPIPTRSATVVTGPELPPDVSQKPSVEVAVGQPAPPDLVVEDIIVGTGSEATIGKTVVVNYVGVSQTTGKEFDSSWSRNQTFSFPLGAGRVIPGWDRGVAGMKTGGRRRLTIPPELAYGSRGAGGAIGPDETLVFVVDLVGVQ